MPRHDRAYGVWVQPGRKQGTSKRTRTIRRGTGYRKKVNSMGRHDGNTPPKDAPKPQGGKPRPPKGGGGK